MQNSVFHQDAQGLYKILVNNTESKGLEIFWRKVFMLNSTSLKYMF